MPLTTKGIAIQVLASIGAYRANDQVCTVNDCKVVVNHLIRKFSEPLGRTGKAQLGKSMKVQEGAGGKTVRDHAVPVIVLVEELLKLDQDKLSISDENIKHVEDFLTRSIYVVNITVGQDRLLCSDGYRQRMPEHWSSDGHFLGCNPFVRYEECGIEVLRT